MLDYTYVDDILSRRQEFRAGARANRPTAHTQLAYELGSRPRHCLKACMRGNRPLNQAGVQLHFWPRNIRSALLSGLPCTLLRLQTTLQRRRLQPRTGRCAPTPTTTRAHTRYPRHQPPSFCLPSGCSPCVYHRATDGSGHMMRM